MSGVRRWLPAAAIMSLLAAAILSVVFANPVIDPSTFDRRSPVGVTPYSQDAAPHQPAGAKSSAAPAPVPVPAWVTWLGAGACVVLMATVFGTLSFLSVRRRLAQRRPTPLADGSAPSLAEARQDVQDALTAGLEDLDDGLADPRTAVIACWARLEAAAAAAGEPRLIADTSTDLVRRLLGRHLVATPDVLDQLAAAYRAARYAPHAVDGRVRDQARSALRQLRDELASASADRPDVGVGAS